MTSVTVLGLGRMGTAIADRLSPHHTLRTWSRRTGGSPADAVTSADVVLLCLFDGAACREVLEACLGALSETTTVVNTTTLSPAEATALDELVTATGAAYLHAPVLGSTPAVSAGRLTILAGGKPSAEVGDVLAQLGETLVLIDAAEAAGLKLVANGTLADGLLSVRRALARGDELGLPRESVLDVLERGVLARLVDGRRDVLGEDGARPMATFALGALRKDLALLARTSDTASEASTAVGVLLASGAVGADDDVALLGVAAPDLSWLADARLDVSPEVVADPDVLRPLHAYALTHATGDPAYLDEAFLPTAHIEGYRDGAFVPWDLEAFRRVFSGPAPDEDHRTRRIERLDVRGSGATATMSLHPRDGEFTAGIGLVRRPAGAGRIRSKAYERRTP
jgi:3-hydroxyisobutyrate dehydrogenase-like beta-hydroxyacid dehydrogenase